MNVALIVLDVIRLIGSKSTAIRSNVAALKRRIDETSHPFVGDSVADVDVDNVRNDVADDHDDVVVADVVHFSS